MVLSTTNQVWEAAWPRAADRAIADGLDLTGPDRVADPQNPHLLDIAEAILDRLHPRGHRQSHCLAVTPHRQRHGAAGTHRHRRPEGPAKDSTGAPSTDVMTSPGLMPAAAAALFGTTASTTGRTICWPTIM